MRARQIVVGVTAWVLAVGSVASLSWVAINSAGHEVVRPGRFPRSTGAQALPATTPPANPIARPNVPKSSPSVTDIPPGAEPGTSDRAAARPTALAPTEATLRSQGSPTVSSPPPSAGRRGWRGDGFSAGVPDPGDRWPDPARTTDQGSDEFERWLAGEFASSAAGGVPWWYGGNSGTWHDGRHVDRWPGPGSQPPSGQDGGARVARAADGAGAAAPGWSTRSLSLDGGLVWLSCDRTGVAGWAAIPQDGWAVRVARRHHYLQARFRSEQGTVEVQAGCADSRPAFRYREQADGSPAAGAWKASLS